jgi:hypothetical protein
VVGISAVTGTRAVKASGHVPYASGGGGELAGKDNAAKDAKQLVHAHMGFEGTCGGGATQCVKASGSVPYTTGGGGELAVQDNAAKFKSDIAALRNCCRNCASALRAELVIHTESVYTNRTAHEAKDVCYSSSYYD